MSKKLTTESIKKNDLHEIYIGLIISPKLSIIFQFFKNSPLTTSKSIKPKTQTRKNLKFLLIKIVHYYLGLFLHPDNQTRDLIYIREYRL